MGKNHWFSVMKSMVGLIVEEKNNPKSIANAPDLLLIGIDLEISPNPIIIPIEIKTITSEPNTINRKFLRDVTLSNKQLTTTLQLIHKMTNIRTYGFMVFCFIHMNKITIKYKKYI